MRDTLLIAESHPVQYHAPVYREIARCGTRVVVVYGSDFSVAGYTDREFRATFAWDSDLLSGYDARFLSRVGDAGPGCAEDTRSDDLRSHLAREHPAALLLLGYSSRFDRGAWALARRSGVPVIFRGETTDHAVSRPLWKRMLRDAFLRTLYRRCQALLYIGAQSRAHFRRLGVPEEKLVFSPYCVPTSCFRSNEDQRLESRGRVRASLGIGSQDILLLFSGKLSLRKGVDLLPAAARAIPSSLRERLVLAFMGEGALRETLASECARTPAIRVCFLGFQNQSRLSDFYHSADLLTLPSRHGETWGVVVNEALHHGLPVVASDAVGSVPDLVHSGVTGEMCVAGDGVALAAAITRALPLLGREDVRDRCRSVAAAYSVEVAASGVVAAMHTVKQ